MPFDDRRRHVARIGVVFGQRTQLWWDLPVIDGFELLRDIYRVDAQRYRRVLDELVALLRLEKLLDQPVRQLSLGQRMRAEIAAAMLHEPAVLFLDEPTIGLDAPSKLAVREFIRKLNEERGVTVLLTTHDMQDIEALARRVIVIGNGARALRRFVRHPSRGRARNAPGRSLHRGSHLALLRSARRDGSMSTIDVMRPYTALFASRFQQMFQYRGAAVAGFITQCWWGGLK